MQGGGGFLGCKGTTLSTHVTMKYLLAVHHRSQLEQYLHALHFLFTDRVTPFAPEVGVSQKICGARNTESCIRHCTARSYVHVKHTLCTRAILLFSCIAFLITELQCDNFIAHPEHFKAVDVQNSHDLLP